MPILDILLIYMAFTISWSQTMGRVQCSPKIPSRYIIKGLWPTPKPLRPKIYFVLCSPLLDLQSLYFTRDPGSNTSQRSDENFRIGLILFFSRFIYGNGRSILISSFNDFQNISSKRLQILSHSKFPENQVCSIKNGGWIDDTPSWFLFLMNLPSSDQASS